MLKEIIKSDKFFIAGGAGMAGSAIYRALKKAGYGNPSHGGRILTPSRKELDLLDQNQVKRWFEENQPTVVINAAAKVGGIIANASQPATFLIENLKIQTNVIETSWEFGVKRLLFLGSSCIYPKFAKQPIQEEELLQGSLEVTNECYAISKIAGIKLCEALRKQFNFDAICLMPTNLYGPGDNYDLNNSHVMAALIRKFSEAVKFKKHSVTCWGSGKPLREFLHVNDLGDASVFVLENWSFNSNNTPLDKHGEKLNYLNVGTGLDISIKSLAKKIALATDFKGEIIWDLSKPDGTPKKQLNVNKLKELGWVSKISLDDGILETVKNYKNFNN